jgi:glycosyltransferase involved in cell wall biosynthesis
MTLTLAIPCHDDAPGLARLLRGAAPMGCVSHVVVVDDGSPSPLDPGWISAETGLAPDRLTLLRNDTPTGPGAARNRALAHVPTPHLLFVDADDLVTPELPDLMADLAGRDFDFCIFRHHDTRMAQDRIWGQMPWDQALWEAAGLAAGALMPVEAEAATQLAQTANYPWNKLYRTDFLREYGIGCSDIPLHEDVELHWRSFLRARAILASDRIGVVHYVAPRGSRMTNQRGPDRLALFAPLETLARDVAPTPLALPFFRFALGLCLWVRGALDPAHHAALADHVAGFLGAIPPEVRAQLASADPELIAAIDGLIARG